MHTMSLMDKASLLYSIKKKKKTETKTIKIKHTLCDGAGYHKKLSVSWQKPSTAVFSQWKSIMQPLEDMNIQC